ncbi:methyltransferase domain-containing protein [Pseudoalteromonas sp. T1lg65]|uniref:methyltransferase domain-containing protein n=1 Tax=Pseudoalteromonas sp. T1lg65 TaxID=2077101 RepID=UPI003F7AEF79
MDLITEYIQQQKWRNWSNYIDLIPLQSTDTVLDLGCSVGNVTHLLSSRVKSVIGVDLNPEFVEFCNANKKQNEQFLCHNLLDIDLNSFAELNGIWASFSLSYLAEPLSFLDKVFNNMEKWGWIAILDVSCFISGNMDSDSIFYQQVKTFEMESYLAGVYDFNFGGRVQSLLEQSGFKVIHSDNDVTDTELNFNGPASEKVIKVWAARLKRLIRLKNLLGDSYNAFEKEFLAHLSSVDHTKNANLKFVVAIK